MSDLAGLAKSKAEALTHAVTSDGRWDVEDELMCQVFGFTLYGYVFGVARVICFMDVDDIQKLVAEQLTDLGIGLKYAEGLVQAAYNEFVQDDNTSLHSQLVGFGHSHFASEDLSELVESVFHNTQRIRESTG